MTAPDQPHPNGESSVDDRDADLQRAYRQAVALAEDDEGGVSGGPAPAVRARVLATAHAIASSRRAAPPAADLGRDRPSANRPAWRLRAGAAACVALLAAVTGWQWNASRVREAGTMTVAMAAPDVAPSLAPPVSAMAPAAVPSPSAERAEVASAVAAPRESSTATTKPADTDRDARPDLQPGHDSMVAKASPSRIDPLSATGRAEASSADQVVASAEPQVEARSQFQSRALAMRAAPAAKMAGDMPAPMMPAAVPAVAAPQAVLRSANEANAPLRSDIPALQRAADDGDTQRIAELLAQPGSEVDAPDARGRTALLHAVLAQRADAVRALLDAGANADHADAAGLTPRAAADRPDIAALLAAHAR